MRSETSPAAVAERTAKMVAEQIGAVVIENRRWIRQDPRVAFAYYHTQAAALRRDRVPFWRLRAAFHDMRARQAHSMAVALGIDAKCKEVAAANVSIFGGFNARFYG